MLLLLSFLPYLGLGHLPCLLSSTLDMMGLCCFFQSDLKLLLLLMSSLHLSLLLFKHIGIILENIGGNGGEHDDTEERQKIFFSVYALLI